jgi:hypothetical protein
MARYGESAQKRVKSAMHRRKRGTLKSGRSGKKVTSRKQAIAIGLSEAREKGGKVPPGPKKSATRSKGTRKSASPGARKKSSGARKRSSKRSTARSS